MSQQIVSTWDGVQNTNSWVHDGDVERSAVDIVELASSVAGYSAGAQAAADAASGYADTASAAVASIGTAATDAVQAVQDEGAAQMSALVDAGGVQTGLIGSAGAAQIADIVTSGGVVTSAIADAGSAEIADIVSAGGAQVALVSAAGTSATGDLAAVTAAQSAALVSAGGYQSGLIVTAGGVQIAAVQAEGGMQIAAVQLAASAQVDSATSAAMIATSGASVVTSAASGAVAGITSAGSAQIAAVNSAGGVQSAAIVTAGGVQSAAVVSAGGAQITAVNSAGAVQSAAVVSAGSTASALIVSTGNTQSAAIVSAGATQSAAVVSEGGLQVGLVQSAGAAEIEAITSAASDYAKKNGNYPDMTVGNAEQIVSEDYLTDQVPYTFRAAGGNVDIGDREYDELVGGTIAWNQYCDAYVQTLENNGVTWTRYADGTVTGVGTATADSRVTVSPAITIPLDHVLFISGCPSGGGEGKYMVFNGYHYYPYSADYGNGRICSLDARGNTTAQIYCYVWAGQTVNLTFVPQFHDLTAMFGTAIADYIYALEQATPGAGVAWFRSNFPKDYYAYDPGTLMSVQAASHDMVGFNQWDEEWANGYYDASGAYVSSNNYLCSKNKIAIFADQQYYLKSPVAMTIRLYDADKAFLGSAPGTWMNETFNASTYNANAAYITFHNAASGSYTTYHNDICINLSWSGYRNGEYEPYIKNSYPLDSTLTLRGIPKLDASNNLYYDGDIYEADGTVTRRYAVKDLGTANWVRDNSAVSGKYRFYAQITDIVASDLSNVTTIMSNGWPVLVSGGTYTPNNGYTVVGSSHALYYYDENKINMTADEFKASMSGVYLVYQITTPTTETADPFQSPQIVSDFGTEQYVDAAVAAGTRDVAIPVGHDTRYMSNLKDKLRRLPNIPDNAGTYLVYYDGTTRRMSCTEYLDGAKVTALEGKVPNAPAEDGTYTLTATVADGEVTYSWVSA